MGFKEHPPTQVTSIEIHDGPAAAGVNGVWTHMTSTPGLIRNAPPPPRAHAKPTLGTGHVCVSSAIYFRPLVGYYFAGAFQPNPQGIEPCLRSLLETRPVISQSCSVSGAS